jgi:hypothetical protein
MNANTEENYPANRNNGPSNVPSSDNKLMINFRYIFTLSGILRTIILVSFFNQDHLLIVSLIS